MHGCTNFSCVVFNRRKADSRVHTPSHSTQQQEDQQDVGRGMWDAINISKCTIYPTRVCSIPCLTRITTHQSNVHEIRTVFFRLTLNTTQLMFIEVARTDCHQYHLHFESSWGPVFHDSTAGLVADHKRWLHIRDNPANKNERHWRQNVVLFLRNLVPYFHAIPSSFFKAFLGVLMVLNPCVSIDVLFLSVSPR